MKLKILISLILIIFFISSSWNTQAGVTIWGPGNFYEITYTHSVKVELNGTLLLEKSNLPITDFIITKLTNNAYNYSYGGYGNSFYVGSILMSKLIINQNEFDYPSGGLPVALPLRYSDTDDWIIYFASIINNLVNRDEINDLSVFLTENSIIKNDLIFFYSNISIDNEIQIYRTGFNLPSIRFSGFNGTQDNGFLIGELSYNLKTGIIDSFKTVITSQNYTDYNNSNQGNARVMQAINFVAIIPPIIPDSGITKFGTSLFIILILIILLVRKRNYVL